MRSAPAVVLAFVLGTGASMSLGPPRTPFIVNQDTPLSYTEDQHWGGFDAPADKAMQLTQLMWIQQSPSLLGGTLVFEVRHSSGTLLCSGSTTCNAQADTDVRASCEATLAPGEHANLMVAAASTCATLPGGAISVNGYFTQP